MLVLSSDASLETGCFYGVVAAELAPLAVALGQAQGPFLINLLSGGVFTVGRSSSCRMLAL